MHCNSHDTLTATDMYIKTVFETLFHKLCYELLTVNKNGFTGSAPLQYSAVYLFELT